MKTKRMMNRITTVVLGLALLNWLPSPVYAQSSNAEAQALVAFSFGLLSPRLLNVLNLTPEQAAKVEVSKKALKEANKAFTTEVSALRKEVADKLYGANPVREADVAPQITRIADLREKILREGFRVALEIRQVLKPDQLAKAAAIRQQLLEMQNEVRSLYNENP